ncbi:uncharacterized protein LOC6526014 isoform X2 [Drosophila yakuba]|uniref:Uncharacterized protein, isoform A n=1 Tax=Drosophila yakuba TaxID=7245 RepID=B4PXI9_DROYA|nr:uncharacterized protein LOC6526014 isoform X2 [Drosophila yakuba]EDX02940.1 uncharacterized protein Dyak_GE15393, isoform A [Drosophila yakuba]KRK07029.1 uncharacterized protein Dyak_GE15393, isoform B [Drosophila yakuba]KRK07030.1 uncharacterized protein Dyak_GE15393, isoform C [Drosophila yakuba]KRK07031.1 uncharacterized protein Dyak_GE15393, isoform D [Drosophila yakuba]KRK07032.1 uncharacterized protein Dyak_GE15393, isoform E [Drosophila yakuba]
MSDKQQEKPESIPEEKVQQQREREQREQRDQEASGSRNGCCGSCPDADAEPEVEIDVEVEEASGSAIGAAAAGGSDAPGPANPNPGLERDRDRDSHGDRSTHRDEFGTQRVYKKTSPNCVLTLYLPTREITLTGNNPSVLRGIVYVDPKAIQGYRVYAQLTLTFRYGREDEEVMGLRFCNEAIMSLHQIWPRLEEPTPESLSPLQEALMKRLGDGAHPFTLSLSSYAPPSVQLVPAKRYYGAPIGTSYDVRCFIADKTDEKFHRRASVKMGVRVIYRTDVFHQHLAPEQYAAYAGRQNNAQSPPASATPPSGSEGGEQHGHQQSQSQPTSGSKHKSKSERGDSFPKLRLSPKSFRFSGRFGRSKSEIEKCPNDPFHSYSKSFQEHCDSMLPPHTGAGVTGGIGGVSVGPCGGPQGSVDKPFLLHDGRVGLRASLDKGWYTHGEDVQVTVNIRNDSRKTVRKVRVCAIQHVDVCMFNNGKFKNVVADSDNVTPPVDRTVAAGASLNTTVTLRPQRGPTKNWIALEDTLQRSTEPEEITGAIAASAIRSPHFVMQNAQLLGGCGHPLGSPALVTPHPHLWQPGPQGQGQSGNPNAAGAGGNEERNVFAIYVSYYVKVKLTLSGMGGELSLKLPFVLVHVDETQRPGFASATLGELRMEMERLALHDAPVGKRNGRRQAQATATEIGDGPSTSAAAAAAAAAAKSASQSFGQSAGQLDMIESLDDEFNIRVPVPRNGSHKRRLLRSETLARDLEEHDEHGPMAEEEDHIVQIHLEQVSPDRDEVQPEERAPEEQVSHAPGAETGAVPKSSNV